MCQAVRAPGSNVTLLCINLRLPTHGGLYAWEFGKGTRELKVRVEGQLVFNGTFQMLNAALAGFGLAYVPENVAQPHLAKRRLMRVLEDWSPPVFGLPPLLSKPTPALGRLCPVGRRAAPSGLASNTQAESAQIRCSIRGSAERSQS